MWAPEWCKDDRELVLLAVKSHGRALGDAAERFKSDVEIVLEAVQQSGDSLMWAAEHLKGDRTVVLTAIQQDAKMGLRHATEACRSDREIVLTAVKKSAEALLVCADHLLEDVTFAPEAKADAYILKISMLSGRSVHLFYYVHLFMCSTDNVVCHACRKLGLACDDIGAKLRAQRYQLLHGTEFVPMNAVVATFPGIKRGAITEYQLLVTDGTC